MTAAKTAGVCLVLVGMALAGSFNDVWNPARPASRGFPGAWTSRSLAIAQRQEAVSRSRLTPASWHSALSQRGSAPHLMSRPRLDGQFMVDTAINYGSASTQQCNPAVAFDGNNYLVAWTDYRDTLFNTGVQATMVTPDGAVLEPNGFMIDTMGLDPAIGFDGTNYLVIDWGAAIQGFRVSPAGEVLDSSAIVISSSDGWHQALAFDGTNYLVVWEDFRDSVAQVYGARVTPGGVVLDTAGIPIGTGPDWLMCPAITFDSTNFLVVWEQACDSATSFIRGARVSPAGQVLDSAFVVNTSSGADGWYSATVSSDGANSLVVWQDYARGIRGALVASDGSVVDTGIALAPVDYYQGQTSLFDGADFLVAWANSSAGCVMASRVSRTGIPLDTPAVSVSAPTGWTERPACAFDGRTYFTVWDDFRSGCANIFGARLTQQMNMLDTNGIGISRSTNMQYGSSVAFDGNNYLVAWTDTRSHTEAIFAARVSPDGVNLDPAGIPICTLGYHREFASVAFDGTNYLVAWVDGRRNDSMDVYAARVTKAGDVLDPQGIPLVVGGDAHIFPVAAFNGSNYLLVWDDLTDSGMCTIRCARVTPAGQILDSGDTICTAWSAWMPAVTANGANWLVAWHDWRNENCADVYAARIDAGGQVLDSGGFALGAGDVEQACAALASDGTNYLAVWERLDKSMLDVRGARISTAGVLLDSFLVQPAVDSFGTPPRAGFDGTNYGVVWVDSSWGSAWGISGARIDTEGEVIDVGRIAAPLQWRMYYPMVSMALGAGSQALCAYPCWTDEYQSRTYGTERIWGRIGALAGVEEMTGTPLSGLGSGTIVRGVLMEDRGPKTGDRAVLLDAAGRKVMELRPGANDVRALAPGVYFVREEPQASSFKPQAVRKVVVTR